MLFLRTFGGVSLENGGRPLVGAAGQRRPLAVLSVIAAAGDKGISREILQSLFWPDSDPEHARGSLKQILYSFRRDVNEQAITLGTGELRLNPAVITSDVGAFKTAIAAKDLEAAVNSYGGRFLDGFYVKELNELARWVERERELLANEYRTALGNLAKAASNSQDHDAAARWWAKLATDDPHASRIALAYMRALAMANEREAAIRHGEVHARIVREDLEAEPDPAIASLIAELRVAGSLPKSSDMTSGVALSGSGSKTAGVAIHGERSVVQAAGNTNWNRSPFGWILGGGLALIVTVGAVIGIARNRADASASVESSRLVVIPFENRTGDSSLDALGSMGADWITDGLARIALVPVADPATAASAVKSLDGKNLAGPATLREIASLTGATSVVSGSFYRRRDSLEFHARISDAKTGRILGAIEPVVVPVSRADEGVESLRQHTLSLLAKVIDARISQVVMPEMKPPAFAAYKEFVAGVDLQARRAMGESDLGDSASLQARVHFRKSYSLDTTFTTALVWALFTYMPEDWPMEGRRLLDSVALRRNLLTPLDRHAVDYFQATLKRDKHASMRAVKAASDLAPRSEWSWMAGQMIFPLNRPREVLKYFSRLDPDHGWMRHGWEYYWYLTAQSKHMIGDLPGTHQWLKRARVKFPANSPVAAAYARSLALSGHPDSVAPIVTEILESDVEWKLFYVYSVLEDLRRHKRDRDVDGIYRQVLSWYQARGKNVSEAERRYLGLFLFSMNMKDAASNQFAALVRDFATSTWKTHDTGHLAVLAAMQGDSAAAKRLIASVPKTIQRWDGENSYWRARVAAQLGKKDEAVGLLQMAFAEGYPQVSLSHSTWYDFPPLQGYPSFEALVASDR